MDFCKEFNARTAHFEFGVPVPTVVNVNPDRTFTFTTNTPHVSYFIKKTTGIDKGTGRPGPSAFLPHWWQGAYVLQGTTY